LYGLKRNSLKDNHQIDPEFDRGGNRIEGKINDEIPMSIYPAYI